MLGPCFIIQYLVSFLALQSERESWLLCFYCLAIVNVLLLFLTVPLVGLQCAIVSFFYHTHKYEIVGSMNAIDCLWASVMLLPRFSILWRDSQLNLKSG